MIELRALENFHFLPLQKMIFANEIFAVEDRELAEGLVRAGLVNILAEEAVEEKPVKKNNKKKAE